MLPAVAPGFRAVTTRPRLSGPDPRAGRRRQGLLLLDLTAFERDLLDAFEGDEYRRASIPVMIEEELHEADAYLPAVAVKPDAAQWTLEAWQAAHKPPSSPESGTAASSAPD